jgi:hypothetical protein
MNRVNKRAYLIESSYERIKAMNVETIKFPAPISKK